jgi:DNA-binding GntR family transcriptional regulator
LKRNAQTKRPAPNGRQRAVRLAPVDSTLPLHAQLKSSLTARIAANEFGPGGRLPSQRALCDQYGMSHMTVRRAINELIHEGAILAVPGKGLFSAEHKQDAEAGPLIGFSEDMARRGMVASTEVQAAEIIAAPAQVAHKLGVVPGTPLAYLRRLRLADGEPMALQSSYLPDSLCPGLLNYDLERQSLFAVLRSHYGLRLASAVNAVEAGLAGADEAVLLGLARPAALLVTEQLTYLQSGHVIEFVRSTYRADRYRLRYNPIA